MHLPRLLPVLALFSRAASATVIPSSTINEVSTPETHSLTKRSACDAGNWIPWLIIGGRDSDVGPVTICETHWGTDYQPIVSLEAWTDNDKITGLRVSYAGGAVGEVWGRINNGNSGSISVDYTKGERFTTVINYGNGIGTRLGHIYAETSGGQKLDIGKDIDDITPYPMDVGGGILLGIVGSSGEEINAMGYLFIASDVVKVTVGQMTFDPDPSGTNTSLSPVVLSNQHYYNEQVNGNVTWTFQGVQTETQSNTYTQTSTTTFGGSVQVEISAELFGIGGKVTTGFTWEKSEATESASSTTSTVTLNWGQSGSLLAGQGVDCTAYVQKGQGNFKYSSQVTMLLEDGTSYTYMETGQLNNVAISEAYISVKEDDEQNAPAGVSTAPVSTQAPATTLSSATTTAKATTPTGGQQPKKQAPPKKAPPRKPPPKKAATKMAPPKKAPPKKAPPKKAPPNMAPPKKAPPKMAPPNMAPPNMAPPKKAPPKKAPPNMPPPKKAPPEKKTPPVDGTRPA